MSARLDNRVAALATMSRAQLRDEWAAVYEAPAPRLSPDLLRLGIGYRLQEKAGKPLGHATLRALQSPAAVKREPPSVRPGTQLIRTWHGRTISVAVEDKSFLFEGRSYGSLSRIAREVTGVAWSGPRFFGLTGEGARG